MNNPALLALENGSLFYGQSIGVAGQAVGEVVFNTAMTGYQEILSDPSYCKQIVTLTQPHIGNVGCNVADDESASVFASGLVVRDASLRVSNWRAEEALPDYLIRNNVVAIADIDTRRLTNILRREGALKGCIVTGDCEPKLAVKLAQAGDGLLGLDLAKVVSTDKSYQWQQGSWSLKSASTNIDADSKGFHVVAYDFGMKRNIMRLLVDAGCLLTVVPAQTAVSDVLAHQPDGVFLSNGPGDPEPCDYAIAAIREFVARGIPLFGICLGYQLLCLAMGAKTIKMKFGHHGANHPVQCLDSQRVMISSQNHSFAVDEASLPETLRTTHRSLFDSSLQGVHHNHQPAFGFQGHPEASPGPHDMQHLFSHFIELMSNT